MDIDVATWLAELIGETLQSLERRPGLTVEVDGSAANWVQIVPEVKGEGGALSGFVVNFAFRGRSGDPVAALKSAGLHPPPGTRAISWEDGVHAIIWIRRDVPLVALALLVGSIHEKIGGAREGYELTAQIEHGL